MEASDCEELQPLLKSKSETKATKSTMFQDVFCVILLLFPGKDTKEKVSPYQRPYWRDVCLKEFIKRK